MFPHLSVAYDISRAEMKQLLFPQINSHAENVLQRDRTLSHADLPEDLTTKMKMLNPVTYLAFGGLTIVRVSHCF